MSFSIQYLVQRFLLVIPTLLGISIATFLVIELTPGDPAQLMLGERASPERIRALREEMGLNDHALTRYIRYMRGILQGDFGRSIRSNRQVSEEAGERFPATFELALAAMLIASVGGIFFGIFAAVYRGSFWDRLTMGGSVVGVSMPIFWLGIMMIWLFGWKLRWLPLSGRIDPELTFHPITHFYLFDSLIQDPEYPTIFHRIFHRKISGCLAIFQQNGSIFKDTFKHLMLPAFTLSTIPFAIIARMTRTRMIEVMTEDYIRTAIAKGVKMRTVLFKHALRNAILPVVTVIGLEFGYLLGGAVLTETVFAWPGMGTWLLEGVISRNFPVVQGGTLIVATLFVSLNLCVDLFYHFIDPRLKHGA